MEFSRERNTARQRTKHHMAENEIEFSRAWKPVRQGVKYSQLCALVTAAKCSGAENKIMWSRE